MEIEAYEISIYSRLYSSFQTKEKLMSESAQLVSTVHSFQIPKLPIKTVVLRAENILPIMTCALGRDGLFLSEKGWKYRLKEMELGDYIFNKAEALERITGLNHFEKIVMYHQSGNRESFQPTLGEVLSQIPERVINKTVAFEIMESALQKTEAGKKLLEDERLALNQGYIAYVVQLFSWDNATNMPPAIF